MDRDAKRAAIVAEALTWMGTPFHHASGMKRVGCDCIFLAVRTFQKTGYVSPDFDPRPYPRNWHMHHSEELILKGLAAHDAKQVEEKDAGPGDIALYRIGRTASHVAIIVDDDYIVHAYAPQKNVGLHERRSPLRGFLDSYWTVLT